MKENRILSWESHLIARSQAGDSTAFELLSDLYRPVLLQMATRMMRHRDDAHDIVQDVLLKAFRALPDFDAQRPIKPWLCRICANCCVDAIRNRRRDVDPLEAHEYMLAGTDTVHSQTVNAIEDREVQEAVQRLPRRYRQILHMRHYEHMDVNEIADHLQTPEGTVKSWLFRARALLRKELQIAGML
jgi:RNA polymerase sigma-70 factor (ECF subfamily)